MMNRQDAKTPRGRRDERTEPSEQEDRIGRAVVHAAYKVHAALGPGLLESVYEVCFCHELRKAGFAHGRQVPVPIVYDGLQFDEGFRMDVFVDGLVICELKAVERLHPVYEAQLLSHLRLTGCRLGFLINFHVPVIKDGIKRLIRGSRITR